MSASPAAAPAFRLPHTRGGAPWVCAQARSRAPGPLGWLVGGVAALAAAAAVAAVLFAVALVGVALMALLLTALAPAVAKPRRGGRPAPRVITARWTGYGWNA